MFAGAKALTTIIIQYSRREFASFQQGKNYVLSKQTRVATITNLVPNLPLWPQIDSGNT